MIYQPGYLYTDLRLALAQGIFRASLLGLVDFFSGDNKPWAYYVGAAGGYTAAATSVPGAAITFWAAGEVIDAAFLHSPEGSIVDVYQDGVLHATFDTFDANDVWQTITIATGVAALKRWDIVNRGVSPSNVSGRAWFAMGAFSVSGAGAQIQERSGNMPIPTLVSFSMVDADGTRQTAPFFIQDGLTVPQVNAWVTAFAPLLDAVTACQILSATAALAPALPAGLKATPIAGVEAEVGALLTFDTPSQYAHSIRIPGLRPEFFAGQALVTTGAMATLITALTDGLTAAGAQVRVRDGYDNQLVSRTGGRKSIRRK